MATDPLHERRYLGDSVYAEVDCGMIKLTTDNGLGPSNTIYLEDEVYRALVQFYGEACAAVEEPHAPDCLCDPCTCSRCGKHKHDGKCG